MHGVMPGVLRSKCLKTIVVLQKYFCQSCARNTVKRWGLPQKRCHKILESDMGPQKVTDDRNY